MRILRSGMKLDVLLHECGNKIVTVIVIFLVIDDARLFGTVTSGLKFSGSQLGWIKLIIQALVNQN